MKIEGLIQPVQEKYLPKNKSYVELVPTVSGKKWFEDGLHTSVPRHQVQHVESQIVAPPTDHF